MNPNTTTTGEDCLSSVQALRNNSPFSGVQGSSAQRRLFSRDWKIRERIILSLRTSQHSGLERRADRIDWCCHSPQLRRSADGKASLWLQTCKDRLCPHCQRERGRIASAKILSLISGWPTCRFITLTQLSREEPLSDSIDRLHDNLRRFRLTPFWRRHVRSGVWSIEVTRNTDLGTWHVHVHILAEGEFIPQNKLSDEWLKCTGDSKVCDIRAVHDREKHARYIADYVSKPFNVQAWTWEDICEYASALHRRRLVHTFGTAHAATVDPGDQETTPPVTELCGPLSNVAVAAGLGCPASAAALEILTRMGPKFAAASGQAALLPGLPIPAVTTAEIASVCQLVTLLAVRENIGHPLFTPEPPEPEPLRPRYETRELFPASS